MFKYANRSFFFFFPWKDQLMILSGYSLCTEPWGIKTASLPTLIKNYFFVYSNFVGLREASSSTFRIRWLGSIPEVKIVALDVGFKPLPPQREAGSREDPSHCMSLCYGGVCGKNVSQTFPPILMWLFSSLPGGYITQLISGFLSKGIAPYGPQIQCVSGRR